MYIVVSLAVLLFEIFWDSSPAPADISCVQLVEFSNADLLWITENFKMCLECMNPLMGKANVTFSFIFRVFLLLIDLMELNFTEDLLCTGF